MLKIILLFFVCMHSVDLIPPRRGDTAGAHNCSPQFLLRLWGEIFLGVLVACSLQIYVLCALYVMTGLCMFSCFHPVLGEAMLPMDVDGSPQLLPCLWRVIWPGSVSVLLLHLCILVLFLFGKMVATQFLPYQLEQYSSVLPIFQFVLIFICCHFICGCYDFNLTFQSELVKTCSTDDLTYKTKFLFACGYNAVVQ